MSQLTRWKKAVIHIEAVETSENEYNRDELLLERLYNDEISFEEYIFGIEQPAVRNDIRSNGTAVFLIHKNQRYLITARHVIENEARTQDLRTREQGGKDKKDIYYGYKRFYDGKHGVAETDYIFTCELLFAVPTFDDVLKNNYLNFQWVKIFNMEMPNFTVSKVDADLAVISLDSGGVRSGFADHLIQNGYIPITMADIAESPSAEGAEVFAIGFPKAVAELDRLTISKSLARFHSGIYSLPVSTFGRVSMLHHKLNYFWSTLNSYPGNSGAPIVESGKLVGVVSSQALTPVIDEDNFESEQSVGIPFCRAFNAGIIRELLEIQILKDNWDGND